MSDNKNGPNSRHVQMFERIVSALDSCQNTTIREIAGRAGITEAEAVRAIGALRSEFNVMLECSDADVRRYRVCDWGSFPVRVDAGTARAIKMNKYGVI